LTLPSYRYKDGFHENGNATKKGKIIKQFKICISSENGQK